MVTIVIEDNAVSKKDILAYIEKEHIKGEYEVITREEYQKRKKTEPAFIFQLSPAYAKTVLLKEEILTEEKKQRNYQKQQQKYARRFYKK